MRLRLFSKGPKITSGTTVGLTEAGSRRATEYTEHGPKFDIMSTLQEQGVMSVGDLADSTSMSVGEVRKHIIEMKGYVRIRQEE